MYKIEKIENQKLSGVCLSEGFYADGMSAGLKPNGDKDLAFIYSDVVCELASVFTTNKMAAAPIHHAKGVTQTNFIVINSKNANAMTGKYGIEDLEEIVSSLTQKFSTLHNPLMSSTGVIGVRLPKDKIIQKASEFDLSVKNSLNASHAIMTTDAFNKEIAFKISLDNGDVFNIGGIAKGAGMINPAMATMLAFITTDAKIEQSKMQEILNDVNKMTFNAASVDGDTSTNDTVFLMSSAKSNVTIDSSNEKMFAHALNLVMDFMAKALVRDGEGATKLVTYKIRGAKDNIEAEKVAKTLSNSLLIKTALYGEDPNWGRLAMSIGASGVACDETKLTISYDDVVLYEKGVNLFNDEIEVLAGNVMKQAEFDITCDLGMGEGSFDAYGCDLGYKYVEINADYRT